MLQLQTSNRKAFEFYNAAMLKVEDYYQTLNSVMLDQALTDVDRSLQLDPNYFEPMNFKGILFDMKGMFREAIEMYDGIYSTVSGRMRSEVIYNRAVANYHLYRQENIEAAIADLSELIQGHTADDRQKAMANAALGQAYGMMVHHEQKKVQNSVEKYVGLAFEAADRSILLANQNRGFGKAFIAQVKWVAFNAKGISLMFQDDAKRDQITDDDKEPYLERLTSALAYFKKALNYAPRNWALQCNVGSVIMRLGHLWNRVGRTKEAELQFRAAAEALADVLDNLKPNYDFAYYELGRIYRFQQQKELALQYFLKAIEAGGKNASVSPSTIEWNIQQAYALNTSFRQ